MLVFGVIGLFGFVDGLQAGFALRVFRLQVDVFFTGSSGDGMALGVLGPASVDAGILGVDVADTSRRRSRNRKSR